MLKFFGSAPVVSAEEAAQKAREAAAKRAAQKQAKAEAAKRREEMGISGPALHV